MLLVTLSPQSAATQRAAPPANKANVRNELAPKMELSTEQTPPSWPSDGVKPRRNIFKIILCFIVTATETLVDVAARGPDGGGAWQLINDQ